MRISIFGLGYVGCVCAARMAEAGHQVIGVDTNADKVGMINSGVSPIVEPGLGELLAQVVRQGRLKATTFCREAVEQSDLALLCVGTTQRLPEEPAVSLLPGKRNVSQSAFISLANRPYHQVPETIIGFLPAMNAVPMSSALMLADSLET